MRIIIISIFVFLGSLPQNLFAKHDSLSLGLIEKYPPFSYEELDVPCGIYVRQLRAISEKLGITLSYEFLPLQQALRKTKNGHLDGIVGVVYRSERAVFLDYLLNAPLGEVTVSLYTLHRKYNLDELIKEKAIMAAKSGFFLSDDLHQLLRTKKIDLYRFSDIASVIELMKKGRIQGIIHTDSEVDLKSSNSIELYKSNEILSSEATYLSFSKHIRLEKEMLVSKIKNLLTNNPSLIKGLKDECS
ncbi:substrate-binding periplasmic protein [Pseudoalteromonas sp.]|uniref:substrate-binding periplasmic protein n=1 Tax=Pseudoalteromonas sp. TaxID=53249 RepID=UPI003567174F